MKEKIVIIGSGQHAHVVLYNLKVQDKYEIACILDADTKKKGTLFEGYLIEGGYEEAENVKKVYNTNKFFIAFGNMKYRKEVFDYFVKSGWEPVNIIHPDAIVSNEAQIGKGVLIECGCLITPNPVIGNNVVVNTGSQVNHDNIVEDNVYIASGVILSGGVHIKENTLIDDGVVVTLGKTVGKNCIIGAGAVVTRNIENDSVAFGVPAKIIRKNF